MSKKVQLEGNFGGSREDVYPATMAEIVYTQDGKNLEEKMSETNAQLSKLENQINPFDVSLEISDQMVELGKVVKNVTINWAYNREIKNQSINDENLELNVRSKSYSDVTKTTIYTLSATSTLGFTVSKSTKLVFANGIYYGKSNLTTYDSNLIKSLTKELSTEKIYSFTVDASANEYIYYCLPKRLGQCTFTVNGFDGGFDKVATISITNDFGYTEDYYFYKSAQAGLGTTTITVK